MSPDNKPSAGKDVTQGSASRRNAAAVRVQETALKCPRCDSTYTKFCYYNNYNLTQPRHFCKACRRYWTKGGALRNVPVGGGCRRNKKLKTSQRTTGESHVGSSDVGGLKLFQNVSPAMDFQLGGLSSPSFHHQIQTTSGFSPFLYLDPSAAANSPHLGFTAQGFQEMGCLSLHSSLASSMESLSCMNQDLHWKLQQQRFSMHLASGDHNQKENTEPVPALVQKPQPILFQNLDHSSKQESYGIVERWRKSNDENLNSLSTEWFFDNTSYAAVGDYVTPTPTTSGRISGYENANWCGM